MLKGNKIIRHEADNYPIYFSLTDGTTGEPYNLTGVSIQMAVAPAKSSTTNTFVSVGVVTDAVGGKVTFPMDTPAAIAATARTYVYQVRLDTGTELITFMEGLFDIEPSLFN
ncbi:MAG: hypothetical protein ABJO09_01075 [Hyphomicrobiales bacterium]